MVLWGNFTVLPLKKPEFPVFLCPVARFFSALVPYQDSVGLLQTIGACLFIPGKRSRDSLLDFFQEVTSERIGKQCGAIDIFPGPGILLKLIVYQGLQSVRS